ncbi:MAG TPA: HAD-IIIC family phosphatase [Ilumatobacter sp.]|nr:HAD-IIIC family phosphatase [Ilumatobacter sp.]
MTDRSARTAARAQIARWRELNAAPAAPQGRAVLIVASYTANPLEAAVGVGLANADPHTPVVSFADYNQVFQVCLDPAHHGADRADDIVVLWRIEDVFERDFHAWANLDEAAFGRLVAGAQALGQAVAGLAESVSGTVTAADAPVPVGFGLDHHDGAAFTDLVVLQTAMNAAFDEGLGAASSVVERLRVAALHHAHGTLNAFDRRTWLMYRQPHAEAFTQLLAAAIVSSLTGRVRVPPKVIVLDADDTLWSGIAANDGVGNLKCSDAFPGSAHREFQMAVRRLRSRGVLLAVASKNDQQVVDQAFAEVDGMVLSPADIAGWKVSWGPKPQAIAELANDFNLGIDSFVFVDDSDYEIGAVRTQLAGVIALQVPEDIEALPDLLAESGLFRALRVTADDRERTERMLAESGRTATSTTMSHEEFLASLELQVTITEVGASDLGRVTQLINKTNQFNLTTIRRDQADVGALIARDDAAVFAVTVDDRFGEYGLVGVVIAVADPAGGWQLDTVLMSCRVLGRGVETAMLAGAIAELRNRRAGPITGRYVATDRNALVADLLPRHGFTETTSTGGDAFVLPADRTLDAPSHLSLTVLRDHVAG